jgi:NAD(P)-dependent dehydrogenase (short-subunit alcohol dehydrogenase family)
MKIKKLSEKKIIIAGSEGLLGNEIAKYFESIGSLVVRIDLKLGHDLTDEQTVKDIMASNMAADVLITPFAINPQPDEASFNLFDLPLSSLEQYLKVNLLSLFSVCREFAKIAEKNSSIINFSSTYGIRSPKHFIYPEDFTKHIGYSITKSGVIGLTKYLATYLAPKTRVNAIVPGGVENGQSKKFIKNYSDNTPMNRMMQKEEIIGICKFLASEDSSYTTGGLFNVDGGWSAW